MNPAELRKREALRPEADEMLRLYLECEPERAEDLLLQLLSQCAQPLIQEIVSSKLRGRFKEDREDLHNDIALLLLSRLRALRGVPESNQIRHFRDYIAVLSYNACSHYFRRKYPFRQMLKCRLRYILSHDGSLSIWNEQEQLVCGRKEWKGRKEICPRELLESAGKEFLEFRDTRNQLNKIFDSVRQPVRLEDLVDALADTQQWESVNEESIPAAVPHQADTLSSQNELEQTWREISQLPIKQRTALLLSLRDEQGEGLLLAFPATGVASARKIATALEMQAEDLARIWKDLPLGDLRIAEMLGVTRQQVINLRKCARERLSRRLRLE